MGVAVGPLNVPANLYFPVRLTIRGWSDGSSVSCHIDAASLRIWKCAFGIPSSCQQYGSQGSGSAADNMQVVKNDTGKGDSLTPPAPRCWPCTIPCLYMQVSGEPGEGRTTAATAAYTATVSGLTAGQNYRLYRTTGLFSMFTIPPSAAALAATCTSQGPGCLAISFTATGPTMAFTEGSTGSAPGAGPLGVFAATG